MNPRDISKLVVIMSRNLTCYLFPQGHLRLMDTPRQDNTRLGKCLS